jgi:hypothetical protein
MSRRRQAYRNQKRAQWTAKVTELCQVAIAVTGDQRDADVHPDALVRETCAQFPPTNRPENGYLRPNLRPPYEYMLRRLCGEGHDARQREAIAAEVADLRGGLSLVGLVPRSDLPRRSEAAGNIRWAKRRGR